MKISPQNYKSSLITLVVIAGLAICLIFTVARLLNVENDLRTEDTHVNLWQISQTQF
jgi:cell division protein FtsL